MECFNLRGCVGDRKSRERLKLLTIFKFEDLERATGGFSEDKLLGRGSYGSVYKGLLPDGRSVAVKKATCTSANSLSSNELDILSHVESSHIVNLLGFCQRLEDVLLVVEFMDNGTLHDALHSSSGSSAVSWTSRIRFASQVAKAVAVLHGSLPQVIHRDIKSANVLIDSSWNARLADFGLALRGNTQDIMCTPAGTLGYFDPRYDKPERVGPKIDVFSFGILLLEIMSGRQVIDVQRTPMQMVDWALPLIKQGKPLAICDPHVRLPGNTAGLRRMAVVAARCIRLTTSKRPTMAEVVEELSQIRRGRPLTGKRIQSQLLSPLPPLPVPPKPLTRNAGKKRVTTTTTTSLEFLSPPLAAPPAALAVRLLSSDAAVKSSFF